ncbi:MAG: hypothetical protein JJLCMIEE_02099 [Acidimicrobiales bacterium]|nr:MAG: alpha/beta hydrolase [Actinomycetota bacterium]MBV6509032.1 hypothetical protein [Acidimicrobiales bacterium]RIK06257.1 MAG: alpha/beta hydrolase [Acidobacteriota bacterium]
MITTSDNGPTSDQAGNGGSRSRSSEIDLPVWAPSPVRRLIGRYKRLEKQLARFAPARAAVAIPRTVRFLGRSLLKKARPPADGPPVPPASPTLLAYVAIDEAMLLLAMGPNRFPRRADYERVSGELRDALALYTEAGWLADPESFHRTPAPLTDAQVQQSWTMGLGFERLFWDSGYEPHEGEPGRERWLGYATNRTAGAWVLRHRDRARPWLVCIHGFGMGYPSVEFPTFSVGRLHKELGLNVAGPMLPLHGRRKVTRMSGEAFLSFDMMNGVHGLAQSVYDTRRLLTWIRHQGGDTIGVHGVSLGGYVTSLLAGLEDELDMVIAGIPVSDFPRLFHAHSPTHIRLRAFEHEILGGSAEEIYRVVSPLSFVPSTPREALFIYAGLGDRMSRPRQAHDLWKHWGEPTITWYRGSHVAFKWSRDVRELVEGAMAQTLLSPRAQLATA